MKLFVVLLLAVVVSAKDLAKPAPRNRIISMINNEGYPAESSTVTTHDGYIMQLIRIPPPVYKNQANFSRKLPVLLMHGMMGSAEDFVYGGASQGLAYKLSDRGYDVFLGNARGSYYGQQHTTLNPNRDVIFWRYCWEDMGVKDLPAIIDKILSITQQQQIKYVGHMEGTTTFYVMASERSEYVKKVERMVSLGPMAYLTKSSHLMLKKISENMESRTWVMKNLGMSTFRPSNEVTNESQLECLNVQTENEREICSNIYFLFNGYNSQQLNQTTTRTVVSNVPSGGSVREVLHWAQLFGTSRFQKFSSSFKKTTELPEYDLSKVDVPIAIFYAPNDQLSNEEDVQTLINKLPRVYEQQKVDSITNNLDILYSKNLDTLYDNVLDALRTLKESKQTEVYF